MKAFYKIKRDGRGLWLKMYTDGKWPWYAATRELHVGDNPRRQAREIFRGFVAEVRRHKATSEK